MIDDIIMKKKKEFENKYSNSDFNFIYFYEKNESHILFNYLISEVIRVSRSVDDIKYNVYNEMMETRRILSEIENKLKKTRRVKNVKI